MRNKNQKIIAAMAIAAVLALVPGAASAQQFSLQAGTVAGYVFFDNNNNGEEDDGDTPASNVKVTIQGSQTNVVETDENGDFSSQEQAGSVTVTVSLTDGAGKGKTVTTASAGGTAAQTLTVTNGGTVNAEPVGLKGSSASGSTVKKDDTTTLKKTDAKIFVPIATALVLLSGAAALQIYRRKYATPVVKINLLD